MGDSFDLVIAELKRNREEIRVLDKEMRVLNERITDVRVEIARLKTTSRLWGGVAGAIPALLALVISWMNGRH